MNKYKVFLSYIQVYLSLDEKESACLTTSYVMKSAEEIRVELLAKRQQAAEFARIRKEKHEKALSAVSQLHDLGFPFWRILEMAKLDPEYLRSAYRELHLLREIPPNQVPSSQPIQHQGTTVPESQSVGSHEDKNKFGTQRWTADEVRVDLSDSDSYSEPLDSPEFVIVPADTSEKSDNEERQEPLEQQNSMDPASPEYRQELERNEHGIGESHDENSSTSESDGISGDGETSKEQQNVVQPETQHPDLDKEGSQQEDSEKIYDHEALTRERARVEERLREIRAHKEKQKMLDRLRDTVAKRERVVLQVRTLHNSIEKVTDSIEKQRKELEGYRSQQQIADKEVAELCHNEEVIRKELFAADNSNIEEEKEEEPTKSRNLKRSASELEESNNPNESLSDEGGDILLAESPLMCFSSYRLAPGMLQDLSKCFSRTFNSMFVNDLQNRYLCSSETAEVSCTKKNCPDIHASEFDPDPIAVFRYMGSCVVGDPQEFRDNIRDRLSQVEQVNPEGPTREDIARQFIEYRKSVDPTKFLDWHGWNVNRHLGQN